MLHKMLQKNPNKLFGQLNSIPEEHDVTFFIIKLFILYWSLAD